MDKEYFVGGYKMSNETKKKDNNMLYIAVFTAIIIIAIIVIVILKSGGEDSNVQNSNQKATPVPVSVISTEGSQNETINKNIKSIRDVKFGKSHKAIQKAEKNMNDTLDGNYVAAPDGTAAYLTYRFNGKKVPEFFGPKVVPTDNNALLEYVFDKDDKMYEIRLQYGKLPKEVYESIVSNISSTYDNSTYSRTFSHGSIETWWKSKNVTLTAYYQETGVSVYIRKN